MRIRLLIIALILLRRINVAYIACQTEEITVNEKKKFNVAKNRDV